MEDCERGTEIEPEVRGGTCNGIVSGYATCVRSVSFAEPSNGRPRKLIPVGSNAVGVSKPLNTSINAMSGSGYAGTVKNTSLDWLGSLAKENCNM